MNKNQLLRVRTRRICVFSLLLLAAGCGGGYQAPPAPPSSPAVTVAPSPVTFPAISEGSTSTPTIVTVTNSGSGALNISSVAFAGSNPADFANTNNCSGSVASMGMCTISVSFVPVASGPLSETITLTDNAANSPQVINVSGTANAIAINLTPPASAIGTSGMMSFVATGDPNGVTFSVTGAPFRGSPNVVASPGLIDVNGNYTAPGGAQSFYATVTATSKTDPTKSAFANINVVAPGAFASTNNVQVAQYTVTPPSPASASVQFGLTTAYGLNTWTQPTTTLGSSVSLFVAGMTQSTPYHMQGLITFQDGSQFSDADFTFTTGALPANMQPVITTTTTAGMTPQPGVELIDMITTLPPGILPEAVVTDLSGNVLWAYEPTLPGNPGPDPVKLLPNGHFLIVFSGQPDGANFVIQEVDFGNNVIWQMNAAQLNTALAAATCAECNVTVIGAHHDFLLLPNGHLILIASLTKTLSDGTTPTGDIIIDLDQNHNVVWAWNEFNHLDTNRRPYSYPDWTHTNAVIYSKDDGNLIISSRHQNWLIKIPYQNGAGSGDPIWKLGAVLPTDTTPEDTADFTLLNADGSANTDPSAWFYAQHGPAFTSTNTTGQFSLILFSNGDDRGVGTVAGGTCGAGQPVSCFSTVPILNLDETAKTATLVFNPTTPDYSWFGGNAEILSNGNVEYDECGATMPANNSVILEVTHTTPPQTVWKMNVTGQYSYRAMRIPSLYPGVQW